MQHEALMWTNKGMVRLWLKGGRVGGVLLVLAGGAFAAPRLERERCTFKPPRGDRVECFTLIVPENREQPEGREVRLKVAVLKAKRTAGAEPMFYLSEVPAMRPWLPPVRAPMRWPKATGGTRPPPFA